VLVAAFATSPIVHAAPTTPVSSPEGVAAQPAPVGRVEPSEMPVFGPIRAKDPEVRAQIQRLYRERNELRETTTTRLEEIYAELGTVTDADLRAALMDELGQLKRDLELGTIELELTIAQLNGDTQRAADFELALDQLRHPEQYLPHYELDPERQAARMREMGIDGGSAQ
jgi:hypothetical protein